MDIERLKQLLNSQKGQQAMSDFAHKLSTKVENKARYVENLKNFLLNYEGNLDVLLDKYYEHNRKIEARNYELGYEKQSLLSSIIFETFVQIGTLIDSESTFSAGRYLWKRYAAELIVGQGSYISISKVTK